MRISSRLRPPMLAAATVLFLVACSDPEPAHSNRDLVSAVPAVNTEPGLTVVPASPEISARSTAPRVRGPVAFADAEAAYREGRYEEAVALFSAYRDGRPENPWGHYMLGLAARRSGQLDLAEAALERTLELDPAHRKSLVNLARVYLDQDKPAEALDMARQAVVLNPTAGDGHRLVGRALAELGQVDEATRAYRQAILQDDQDAWSMNNLGLLLIQTEQFAEAVPPLARAVELRPGVAVFHNNLGIALERSGYPVAAKAAYGSALAVDSSYAKAQVNFARVDRSPATDSVVEDVDLGFLAQDFVAQVEAWRASGEREVSGDAVPGIPPVTEGETGKTKTSI